MTGRISTVRIEYLRPPDRRELFVQELVLDTPEVKVTLARSVTFEPPIRILDEVALETGSDALWFTFPGRWHDIGRFHRADGTFTGFYANVLTPPVIGPRGNWTTTDLFLDVWTTPDGELFVLDEDQLQEALGQGWISAERARRARAEVVWIQGEHAAGRWPPAVVRQWTLDRALQRSSSTSQDAQRRPMSR